MATDTGIWKYLLQFYFRISIQIVYYDGTHTRSSSRRHFLTLNRIFLFFVLPVTVTKVRLVYEKESRI